MGGRSTSDQGGENAPFLHHENTHATLPPGSQQAIIGLPVTHHANGMRASAMPASQLDPAGIASSLKS